MLTKQDINIFFSQAYAISSLREDLDMRIVADLFESVRVQLNIAEPYDSWDFIILDYGKFDNDTTVQLLIDLKESYFNFFFEKLITDLNIVYKNNKEEALRLWMQLYAEAAVHYRDDLLCMLCYLRVRWKKKDESVIKYGKLPKLIQEGRWPDAYPAYAEISANTNLTKEVRAFAEITLLEIILYNYPEYSRALKHIENAASMLPDHFIIKRGWAEYYLKTGNTQKARNGFLQVIAMKPGDYFSFNSIGDCFNAESKLENAESWYNDALQKNFLQTDSYARLINLYGDKTWFKDKESLIENLLCKIEKRHRLLNTGQLVEKKLATEDCFKDPALYQSYRDVGAAWFANGDIKKSEEWYTKARNLQPGFPTAIIDIAYLKIHQHKPKKAKEYFLQARALDKDNFEVYWGLAYFYEKQDQKEEAIKAYQECFRLRPHWNDWINNFIGNLYYSSKEFSMAVPYYRKAIVANDNYPIYKQNLADAMQAQADQLIKGVHNAEAEKLYLSAANLVNEANRWNTLGNFYYRIKRWEDAVNSYNKAIALKNSDPVYYENRGLAFEKMNKVADAEESYKEALKYDSETGRYFNRLGVFYYGQKDYDRSVDHYLKALERNPDEPVYMENISITYEQMNQQDKAEPYYLKLLEKDPANDKIMNQLGILYFKRKEYEKAKEFYKNAILHNNRNAIYNENLGILFRDLEKLPEAIAEFEKALELDPKNDVNWNDTGVLYFNLGNYDKALEYYNKAVELKPKVSLYYENIALAYEGKQLFTEAISNYEKALQINSKNARVLNGLGLVYYNRQEFESAIKYYQKAVDLDNNNWVYQTNLGLALRLSHRINEAIDVYQKVIKLKEDDYLNWNELGVLLYEKGELDEAVECYKKSINLQPNDAMLYMNLALALNALGKTEEALNVTAGHRITNEVKQQVEAMMQQYLPSLVKLKMLTPNNYNPQQAGSS